MQVSKEIFEIINKRGVKIGIMRGGGVVRWEEKERLTSGGETFVCHSVVIVSIRVP